MLTGGGHGLSGCAFGQKHLETCVASGVGLNCSYECKGKKDWPLSASVQSLRQI